MFDADAEVIRVEDGAHVTLGEVARAIDDPAALRELDSGAWLLGADLEIEAGGTLLIAAPEVRWLKMRSDAERFVSIKALGGQLTIQGTCVTSWEPAAGRVDTDDADGRSFVLARDGAQLTVDQSELSYLGYDANESYGVALRLEGTRGTLTNSVFGHNFYGIYSYAASNLVIRDNDVHHSARYGIDPHTRSNRLLIEGNTAHHNGKQGIILAENCDESTIRNNVVYSNQLHGIVIYQNSDNNVVEGNVAYGNGLQGINVNDSADNTIRGNTVYENVEAGIGVGQAARRNLIAGNAVERNGQDGIYLFSAAADNEIRDNTVRDNRRYGIYVKSARNHITTGNEVTGNRVGVRLNAQPAPALSTTANRVFDNRDAQIEVRAD